MKNQIQTLLLLVIAFAFKACESNTNDNQGEATASPSENIVPGPRNCFWSRGPVSADPYMNVAYPDAGVFYWSAIFTIPEGAKLEIEGEFPHSRYMSFISYDGRGIPQESLADYLINAEDGHVNPYLTGSDRAAEKRTYRIEIKNQPAPPRQIEGFKLSKPDLENLIVNKSKNSKYGSCAFLWKWTTILII